MSASQAWEPVFYTSQLCDFEHISKSPSSSTILLEETDYFYPMTILIIGHACSNSQIETIGKAILLTLLPTRVTQSDFFRFKSVIKTVYADHISR